jgi:ATP-dependent DNA helicase Q1
VHQDVTIESWQLLKVVEAANGEGGRLTVGMLADLSRGLGGGAFNVVSNGKGKGKATAKAAFDLEEVAGGKLALSKEVSIPT